MKGSAYMYDYTRYGIEKKMRPHTGRKVTRKIISSVLKLILLVVFMWDTSPVSSHFLSQISFYTDKELWNHVDRLKAGGAEENK